jgi:hypothetical protein
MTVRVVDTNVAVVANGRRTNASLECRLRSVDALGRLVEGGCVVIDSVGRILDEYDRHLRPEEQPGVGDRFYRHVLDNRGNGRRVRLVDTAHRRANALQEAFERGTLAAFDRSDRVFALCAVVARAPVTTAKDSDWVEHEAGLRTCGVRIEFVCGREAAARRRP